MTTKESLKALCSNCERHLSLSKQACPFRSISNDYCEEYENIKRDLEVLEAVKNSLIIESIPPKVYFNPNDDYNIELATQHIIKYNQYKLNKEIKEKLTKWIIENIDKETIKGWIKDE